MGCWLGMAIHVDGLFLAVSSVAYVSRSGGMSNELNNIISLNSDGVAEGVAIGGDRFPGSTFLDHILRFEEDPLVAMIVLLGEVSFSDIYAGVVFSLSHLKTRVNFRKQFPLFASSFKWPSRSLCVDSFSNSFQNNMCFLLL